MGVITELRRRQLPTISLRPLHQGWNIIIGVLIVPAPTSPPLAEAEVSEGTRMGTSPPMGPSRSGWGCSLGPPRPFAPVPPSS